MKSFGEVITTVIHRVFEDWAMMIVDPSGPGEINWAEQECSVVEVDFLGVVDGRYLIIAPKEFLHILAVNVLGFDSEIDWAECEDAFREMGNVLSGNLLTEMFGEDTVFDISLPVVRGFSADDAKLLADNARRTFYVNADEQPVAVTFFAEGSTR